MAVRKKVSVTEQNQQLIELMMNQQKAHTDLMNRLLDHITITAESQREWLQLFKPQPTAKGAESFDSRTELDNDLNKKADEWTELDAQNMLKEIGLLSTNEEDGLM